MAPNPRTSTVPAERSTASVGLHHRTARSVTAPTPEDLEIARADALLQLRIGRSSHYYAILISLALVADGAVVLAFPPGLDPRSWTLANLYFLFVPVAGAVFLSIFALFLKWDEFQLWPWERHFWATVLAVVASLVSGYLLVAGIAGFGPTANWPLVPGLLPLSLGAISLAMAGLALTWPSGSRQQLASLISSVVPFPLGFALFLGSLPFSRAVALGLILGVSGFAVQSAGSWLHLISSGTRAHEREMINSGQTRMFAVADELGRRERSIQLREATVLQRETDLDDGELSLKRRTQSADEQRALLDRMEQDLRKRSDALAEEQRKWAAQSSEVVQAGRAAADKESDVALRETQVADRTRSITEREDRLRTREAELVQREAEALQARDDAQRRETAVRDAEARLDARRSDIERRTAELLQQESRLRSRETLATATDQDRAGVAQRLADLEARETRLHQLELSLTDLQAQVNGQSAAVGTATAGLAEREEKAGRAAADLVRQRSLLDRREQELSAAARASEAARLQYEEAVRRQAERTADLDRRQADIDRRLGQLQTREQALADAQRSAEREAALADDRSKALDRRERELRDRVQALAAAAGGTGAAAPSGAPPPAPEPAVAAPGPRRLPDRQSIGVPRMDDLLLGGLPPKAHLLLLGPPFVGKELLLYQFVAEGLRRGESVVLVSAGRPAGEAAEAMRSVVPELASREKAGLVVWIDAAPTPSAAPAGGGAPSVGGPRRPAELLAAVVQAVRRLEGEGHPAIRVGVLGVGHLFRGLSETDGAAFFQNLVGILKPRPALAVYTLDTGMIPEALQNVLKSRTDGVIEFKEDRGRTVLQVRGLGEVETRDWVEYRSGPSGLVLGSFSLERIR